MGKLRKILSAVVHGPERFDELASRIAAVNSSLTEQASGIRTELAERDDRVRTRFEADEQGLRDVEVKVQSAKDRLDGAEQRMASTEKRLDDAEIWVNGAKDRLDNTEIWVNGAKSRVDRIEKTLQEQLNAAGIAEMLCADREILSMVQDLPFRERQIVILYFWNRMTLDDIAQTLGISQATVFRGLDKAKKLLKLELEGG